MSIVDDILAPIAHERRSDDEVLASLANVLECIVQDNWHACIIRDGNGVRRTWGVGGGSPMYGADGR